MSHSRGLFASGLNIAIKVPAEHWEQTIAFYMETVALEVIEQDITKPPNGRLWRLGIGREDILDAVTCDQWKKKHCLQYHNGHNCGICSAVCPFGHKGARRDNVVRRSATAC